MRIPGPQGGINVDTIDRVLLNRVQTGFPVDANPYRTLGELANISEQEAYDHIQGLRRDGIIRRLGGVFDSQKLGYTSTLCAAKVPEEKIPVLTEYLAGLVGVTHNYLRNHEYNMWFTVIAPSGEELEQILERARELSGVRAIYSLPALRLFKIKVDFDMGSGDKENENRSEEPAVKSDSSVPGQTTEPYNLTGEDIALVRALQGDLPASLTPFADLAEDVQLTEQEVLQRVNNLIQVGAMRRFGAVLRHQKAGFIANAMGVWRVPEDQVIEVGKVMASFKEVSHCYQRPTLPDWPYNLFTMVHGRSAEDCKNVIERIADATGIQEHGMLFSTKELKKTSMQYFMEHQA